MYGENSAQFGLYIDCIWMPDVFEFGRINVRSVDGHTRLNWKYFCSYFNWLRETLLPFWLYYLPLHLLYLMAQFIHLISCFLLCACHLPAMVVFVQSFTGLLNLIEFVGSFIPAFLYNNQVLTLTCCHYRFRIRLKLLYYSQ